MNTRAVVVVALVVTAAGTARAQTLAEIARAEEARRKSVAEPSKVYTNDTLKPDFTRPQPEAPAAAGGVTEPGRDVSGAPDTASPATTAGATATPAAADAPARDQAYWSGRITEARSQLERSRAFAAALQNRIDMLWIDFVNRDNPVERGVIEEERVKALGELDRVNKEIQAQTQAIADIEAEARRAGVPPGWLRPA